MTQETIVSSRPDRELRKKIINHGEYSVVPYEDSRCKIKLSNIICKNEAGECAFEPESKIFSSSFDGNVLIGDSDNFIDKDFELILQQMCCGERSLATLVYRNGEGKLMNEITCEVELLEVTEEQVLPDWSWERLHEAAMYHKERGVELVKQKRIKDAFRRFSKSLKMVVAIEPIDPEVITEDKVKEIIELRVKLYTNLAHCQLQFNEYEPALELCNKALKYDPENVKGLYRRSLAYYGLNMFEESWNDIQHTLKLDPNDKAAQQRATLLKPKIDKINTEYSKVIKKMFG